jgi:preprotein translocase subunit SecG
MLVLAAQIPGWLTAILAALFLFFCVLLILAVLIQRPTGGGLSGAFGSGAGSGQTAFGAKTGDALTYATITIFTIYIVFAVGLNYATKPSAAAPAPVTATSGAGTPAPTGTAPIGATGATGTTGTTPAPAAPVPTATFVPPAAPTGATPAPAAPVPTSAAPTPAPAAPTTPPTSPAPTTPAGTTGPTQGSNPG